MRPAHLRNMKEFWELAKRSGQIKPLTNEQLTKKLDKLEKKVHSLEMMLMRTRVLVLKNK